MKMDFKKAAILGSYLSKDYAENLFRLLATYNSISASEAASRLDLHIKTVQDFLEAMFQLDILDREEVYEKKRPYFRYTIKVSRISMEIDLASFFPQENKNERTLEKIREKMDSGARFTTARSDLHFSSVAIWIGKGRERSERKIHLTIPQGKFLYHLPFPSADFQSINMVMQKAGIEPASTSEILDIVDTLIELGIIEKENH